MTTIDFWFDPVSPYAYLAFEMLPEALVGQSYAVNYRPVLFAGLLAHWGQKGPAEIAPKRDWTYRDVLWQGHRAGIPIALPAQHPFNPLPLLRLALACAPAGQRPNRRVAEAVLRHVWHGGADAGDPARLAALAAGLAPSRDPQGDDVKRELKDATADAAARGVFGVPTLGLPDGRLFWGAGALPMLAAALAGDAWFAREWDAAGAARPGLQRR
jgi:2-hydroxychromene-2-carboxylate isomerase